MKSYINNYFLILMIALGLAFSFTSCSDENFVDEEEIIEEVLPDTLPYIFATGIISDSDGIPVSNATIDYLVDGEITNVTTNDQGVYEIRKFDLSSDRTPIRCHSEGFLTKMEILLNKDEDFIEKNIILARNEEFSGGPSDQLSELALSNSLIVIEGRLINEDGDALIGIPILILDFNFSSFNYGITDQDGNWSIAIEPLEDAYVFSFNPCENLELIIDESPLLEDTDIGDFVSAQIQPIQLNFRGFVTDCNTQEGLIQGEIRFSFSENQDIFRTDIINGLYEIEIPQCAAAECIDIEIISFIAQSGIDSFECQTFTEGLNTLDFEVCNTANPTSNGGFLTTILDGQTTEYELVGAEKDAVGYIISGQNILENKGVLFLTESFTGSGTFRLAAVVALAGQEPIYNVGEGAINYQIDSTTTEFLYGTYQGSIINIANGQFSEIEGEFKAKL